MTVTRPLPTLIVKEDKEVMPTRTGAYIEAPTAASTWPTAREIAAVAQNPRRFKRWYERALEVEAYAERHGGKLPSWVWELTDPQHSELACTLRELDDLRWARRMLGQARSVSTPPRGGLILPRSTTWNR